MTRETKIGLLVGLAFIIVIGILLSDHMTSTTEPPKAPLSVAGSNLRESVVTPAAPSGTPGAAAVVTQAPPAVAPTQTVLTGQELSAAQRTAPQTIQVGPAVQPQSPVDVQQGPVVQQPPAQAPVQVTAPPPQQQESPVVVAPPVGQPQTSHPLQQLASRHGEELVPAGPQSSNARPQPVPMAPVREYKAQSGDSLSKMAARFLGSSNKANRDAIVRMNPSLQQNPDKIVEGRTYVLPPAPTADSATASAPPTVPTPATPVANRQTPAPAEAPKRAEPVPAPGENFTWYTVKENENLWKIAAEQLGSGNAWTQIRDLTHDILTGEHQLRVNTRIRLPHRPVASAAH
jgi:nucleoid-associated protein YgaU